MYFDKKQAARFHKLYNRLMMYTHDVLGIHGEVINHDTMKLYPIVARETAERLWEDRAIIDRFVEQNPFELDQRDLATVQQWKYGLSGTAVIMKHTPNGSIFVVGDRVFCVKGISHGFDELVPQTPFIVKTTLIPFEGAVTYAHQIAAGAFSYGPGMLAMFDQWYESALENAPLITADDEFIVASQEIEMSRGLTAIDNLLEDLERKSAFETGEEKAPEGFHQKAGVETPLDEFDELDAAFKTIREEYKNEYRELLFELAVNQKPVHTTEELFSLSTKDSLLEIAADLGIKGRSKLTKGQLVALFAKNFTKTDQLFYEFLTQCSPEAYSTFLYLLEQGGSLSVPFEDASDAGVSLAPYPPFMYLFSHEGNFTVLIADEVAALARTIDFEKAEAGRNTFAIVDHFISTYTKLYGIIGAYDLFDLYHECCPDGLDYQNFLPAAVQSIDPAIPEFTLWAEETSGNLYFINWLISDDFLFEEDDEDEIDYGSSEVEAALCACEDFRKYLLDRHEEITRRVIPREEILDFDVYEHIMEIPQAKQFREFLENHIPDDENDAIFPELVLDEIIKMTWVAVDVAEQLDFLQGCGLIFDTDKTNEMLMLLSNMRNHIPIWANNGWSPAELYEQEYGTKIFYHPNGSPMKVGRNDPCPCGSGKKYKKCCGNASSAANQYE